MVELVSIIFGQMAGMPSSPSVGGHPRSPRILGDSLSPRHPDAEQAAQLASAGALSQHTQSRLQTSSEAARGHTGFMNALAMLLCLLTLGTSAALPACDWQRGGEGNVRACYGMEGYLLAARTQRAFLQAVPLWAVGLVVICSAVAGPAAIGNGHAAPSAEDATSAQLGSGLPSDRSSSLQTTGESALLGTPSGQCPSG